PVCCIFTCLPRHSPSSTLFPYTTLFRSGAFYLALLNSNMGNRHKIAQYLTQAQEAGIKILPPDIENSKADFSLENGKVLVGLKRSEEHTSELQSRFDLVCRLLLEKKN